MQKEYYDAADADIYFVFLWIDLWIFVFLFAMYISWSFQFVCVWEADSSGRS